MDIIQVLDEDHEEMTKEIWTESQKGAARQDKIAGLRAMQSYIENLKERIEASEDWDSHMSADEDIGEVVAHSLIHPNAEMEFVPYDSSRVTPLGPNGFIIRPLTAETEDEVEGRAVENPAGRSQAGPSIMFDHDNGESSTVAANG